MPDLRVDDRLLADCELRLSRLHREFQHLDARRDGLHDLLGASAVADAMDDFYENWSHYRGKLLDALRTVGEQVAQTRTTFRQVEERLAGAPRR